MSDDAPRVEPEATGSDEQDQMLKRLFARLAEHRAEAAKRPAVTPTEAAQAVNEAVRTGGMVVCHATCWACKFDQHREPTAPHPWWDDEDVEHAEQTGRTAPSGNCACYCAQTAEGSRP